MTCSPASRLELLLLLLLLLPALATSRALCGAYPASCRQRGNTDEPFQSVMRGSILGCHLAARPVQKQVCRKRDKQKPKGDGSRACAACTCTPARLAAVVWCRPRLCAAGPAASGARCPLAGDTGGVNGGMFWWGEGLSPNVLCDVGPGQSTVVNIHVV
jgi:hypothetical protein